MVAWRTDKPQGDIIVAKIAESFCHEKECYEVLRFHHLPYLHYRDNFDEVPYCAIEKWALIQ